MFLNVVVVVLIYTPSTVFYVVDVCMIIGIASVV